MRYLSIIKFLLAVFFFSCTEKFEPDYISTEIQLPIVVEGVISVSDPVYRIKIARAINVGSDSVLKAISHAEVMVMDDNNNCYILEEHISEDGVYVIDGASLPLIEGYSYYLKIILDNGEEYLSSPEKVLPIDEINKTEFTLGRSTYMVDNYFVNGEALKVYNNIKKSDQVNYYRYDYDGVYAFKVPYQGSNVCFIEIESYVEPEPTEDVICYKEDSPSYGINIFSTENYNDQSESFLNVVTIPSNRKFAFGYKMNFHKYCISKDYYNFLTQIKDQLELEGSIFNSVPTYIEGNIKSMNNQEPDPLGYFTIETGVSTTVFIDSTFFEEPIRDPLNTFACQHDLDDPGLPDGYPRVEPFEFCCDCRLVEDVLDEPDNFWPES